MRPVALLTAVTLALAAPAGAASVYNDEIESQQFRGGVIRLGGIQQVIVVGTPPPGLTPEAVVAAMRAPAAYPRTRFQIADRPAESYHFVVALGTDTNVGLCARPQGGAQPGLVAMAYCLGDRVISRASMRTDPAAVADDMPELMRVLLRRPNPAFFGFLSIDD